MQPLSHATDGLDDFQLAVGLLAYQLACAGPAEAGPGPPATGGQTVIAATAAVASSGGSQSATSVNNPTSSSSSSSAVVIPSLGTSSLLTGSHQHSLSHLHLHGGHSLNHLSHPLSLPGHHGSVVSSGGSSSSSSGSSIVISSMKYRRRLGSSIYYREIGEVAVAAVVA